MTSTPTPTPTHAQYDRAFPNSQKFLLPFRYNDPTHCQCCGRTAQVRLHRIFGPVCVDCRHEIYGADLSNRLTRFEEAANAHR